MKKKHGQCDFDLRLGKSNIVKRKENLFLGFLSLIFCSLSLSFYNARKFDRNRFVS